MDEAAAEVPADRQTAAHLRDIRRSTERAADLVRRIMTFARPGESRVEPVRLQHVTTEVRDLLLKPFGAEPLSAAIDRALHGAASGTPHA